MFFAERWLRRLGPGVELEKHRRCLRLWRRVPSFRWLIEVKNLILKEGLVLYSRNYNLEIAFLELSNKNLTTGNPKQETLISVTDYIAAFEL